MEREDSREGTQITSIILDNNVYNKVKLYAAYQAKSMATFLRMMIANHIESYKPSAEELLKRYELNNEEE
jgi:hypothetical protein